MTIELPAGFTWRPATMDDVEAVTAVIAASEQHHTGIANVDTDDVRADYSRSSVDPPRDTVLVFHGERLVAEGLVFNGRYANSSVLPDLEGRGLGTALLRWSQEIARAQGGSTVGGTVADENAPHERCSSRTGTSPHGTPGSSRSRTRTSPPNRLCRRARRSGPSTRARSESCIA